VREISVADREFLRDAWPVAIPKHSLWVALDGGRTGSMNILARLIQGFRARIESVQSGHPGVPDGM
jgi:hypothetical protein